jgi:alpha/beta superfamily hydrolase
MRTEKIRINNQISGVLAYPNAPSSSHSSVPAVLLLHGFATTKNEVNNTNQQIAEQLASRSIISLRIDFRGYGDSAGNPEDFSVRDMVDDARFAYEFLSRVPEVNADKMGIIGFSLGAAVALLLSQNVICHSLGLLSPALNLLSDFTKFLGADTINRLSCCEHHIEVALPWRSIKIGKTFYESICDCRPLAAAEQFSGALLCIAGENDFSAENARHIAEISNAQDKNAIIIPGADHIFNIGVDRNEIPSVISNMVKWQHKTLIQAKH